MHRACSLYRWGHFTPQMLVVMRLFGDATPLFAERVPKFDDVDAVLTPFANAVSRHRIRYRHRQTDKVR